MLELVQAWAAQALPEATLPSQWERDVMRTILRIRERELRQQLQQAHNTLNVAQADGDAGAVSGIKHRIKDLSDELRKVQWALAPRPVQA